MRHQVVEGVLLVNPTREDVQGLRVGDMAPDCFGKWGKVVEIFAQQDDIHGQAFACYYTELGPTSRISGSITEGEVTPTIAVTAKWRQTALAPWPTGEEVRA